MMTSKQTHIWLVFILSISAALSLFVIALGPIIPCDWQQGKHPSMCPNASSCVARPDKLQEGESDGLLHACRLVIEWPLNGWLLPGWGLHHRAQPSSSPTLTKGSSWRGNLPQASLGWRKVGLDESQPAFTAASAFGFYRRSFAGLPCRVCIVHLRLAPRPDTRLPQMAPCRRFGLV